MAQKKPDWISGTIPWSADEFFNVMDYYANLHATPKDDWDLRKYGLDLLDETTGEITRFTLNPFAIETQVGLYMRKKYKEDAHLFKAHLFRYMLIRSFMIENSDDLKREEFLVSEGDDVGLSEALVTALCERSYAFRRGSEDDESPYFPYDEVAKRAKEIDDKGED